MKIRTDKIPFPNETSWKIGLCYNFLFHRLLVRIKQFHIKYLVYATCSTEYFIKFFYCSILKPLFSDVWVVLCTTDRSVSLIIQQDFFLLDFLSIIKHTTCCMDNTFVAWLFFSKFFSMINLVYATFASLQSSFKFTIWEAHHTHTYTQSHQHTYTHSCEDEVNKIN